MSNKTLPPARTSELHRTMACPGWRWAGVLFPEPPPEKPGANPMRDSGTAVHEWIDAVIDGKPVEMSLKSAEEWIATKSVEILNSLIATVFNDRQVVKHWTKTKMEWVNPATNKLILTGTPDYFATDGEGKWLINDNKRGPKPVAVAAMNWQVTGYICLVMKQKHLTSQYPVGEFVGVITQPLVSTVVEPTRITGPEVLALSRRIEDGIAMSELKDAPRIPGSHCEYCPVSGRCPERNSLAPIMADRLVGKEKIAHLTVGELKALKPRVDQLKDMIEEFDRVFKGCVVNGLIQGWEPWYRSGGYKPEDPLELYKLISQWMSAKEFRALLKCPTGKIRDSVVERMHDTTGMTKKAATEWWETNIQPKLIAEPKQLLVRPIKQKAIG